MIPITDRAGDPWSWNDSKISLYLSDYFAQPESATEKRKSHTIMFTTKLLATLARELTPGLRTIVREAFEEQGAVTPRYLSIEAAASYLSTTTDGVRGMLRDKRFPVSKIGARVFIDRNEIDKGMGENTQWLG
jgi:excisionase family DNA binding protein